MKLKLTEMVWALFLTLLLLIFLEIFSTTVVPVLGLQKIKLTFNVLIILYLSFYVNTPYLPIFILIIQFFHSIFTIEGWAYGTLTGVLISLLIGHLKDLLHFNSTWPTILITFLFQYLWFTLISGLIYFRMGNFTLILERFWTFIPESIFLSLFAPLIFSLLKKIWKNPGRESNEGPI